MATTFVAIAKIRSRSPFRCFTQLMCSRLATGSLKSVCLKTACLASIILSVGPYTLFAQEPVAATPAVPAAIPLHQRIDQRISELTGGSNVVLASDAEFVRRIYLDLTGSIPSSQQARDFIADVREDKRERLIDELLASPRYAKHLAVTFDVMWMERRGDKYVPTADWRNYLTESFAANKPYNKLVSEVLAADGTDEKIRPASKFILDRDVDPNVVTRDIGRMFFGVDLQCAQCHDHPNIDTYYQADYYGLFAFVNRSTLFTDKDKKSFIAEKADGEADYSSAFTKEKATSLPRLVNEYEVFEKKLPESQQYVVRPAENVKSVPTMSRRTVLAELVGQGKNEAFQRNIVNRLWAHMMGKGLVHPVDLHHESNLGVHPVLLRELAQYFRDSNFDIRNFIRELALSRTYQRSFDIPDSLLNSATPPDVIAKKFQDEKSGAESELATALEQVKQERLKLEVVNNDLKPILEGYTQAEVTLIAARNAEDAVRAKLNTLNAEIEKRQMKLAAITQAESSLLQAAESIPGEAVIQAALPQIQARKAKLTEEQTAAGATKTQLEMELAAKTNETQPLAAKYGELSSALEPKLAERQKLREGLQVALANMRMIEFRLASIDKGVQLLAVRQSYQSAEGTLAQTANRIQVLQATVDSSKQQLATMATSLTEQKAAMAQKSNEIVQLNDKLRVCQEAVARLEKMFVGLNSSMTSLEVANNQIQDPQITQAMQLVAAKIPTIKADLDGNQKQVTELSAVKPSVEAAMQKLQADVTALESKLQLEQTTFATMEKEFVELNAQMEKLSQASKETEKTLCEELAKHFGAYDLKPLSPEQMGRSILMATGVFENYVQGELAELEKAAPATEEQKKDPAFSASRRVAAEEKAHEKLLGTLGTFVGLYGNGEAQPQDVFFATVDQSLFAANGGTVLSWIASGGQGLMARAAAKQTTAEVAEEIYLGAMSRLPTADEQADVEKWIAKYPNDKNAAIREIIWGLLTSAEFRFNH